MPSNKDRLYVCLHARGGRANMPGKEDMYHWSLMVGPKLEAENSTGLRYHAKETPRMGGGSEWHFEELECPLATADMLIVRIMIGKVVDGHHAAEIMRNSPVRQGQSGWSCVAWVKETLETLNASDKALGTRNLEWSKVRDQAMSYCQWKKDQHRFDGQGDFDMRKAPTYDLLEQREVII